MTDRNESAPLHPIRRAASKLKLTVLILLCGWIVGGTLSGIVGNTAEEAEEALPQGLVESIVSATPGHRYYLVFDTGNCGAPFHTTVNYLHHRDIGRDVAVLTSARSSRYLRGLAGRGGLTVVEGQDDLVRQVTEHYNALLIERSDSGRLLVYTFARPVMSQYVAVLDDVLGGPGGAEPSIPASGLGGMSGPTTL